MLIALAAATWRVLARRIFGHQHAPRDGAAFFYEVGMMIDADGGYHSYHPDGKSGLDYLGNAGRPGNWWDLVTDSGLPSGNPIVQTEPDPAPGFYISTTSLEDPTRDRGDPRRYVNAETVKFIVLPGKSNLGVRLGDFCVVIRPRTGACGYAVYADVGPANRVGEASIALANALGVPSSPKNGGVGHGIFYLVFRGSTQSWPLSQEEIDRNAGEFFDNGGGLEKVKECSPHLDWA